MRRRPTKREAERWLEQRDTDTADDLQVTVSDEIVESTWEPDTDEEPPEAGTTVTRCYRDDSGEWTSEEIETKTDD